MQTTNALHAIAAFLSSPAISGRSKQRAYKLIKRIAACTITFSLLTACWVPLEAGRKMRQDIDSLRTDLRVAERSLQGERARLKESIGEADKKISEISKMLAELNKAARTNDADFGVQIEELTKAVHNLEGAHEETNHRILQLEGNPERDISNKGASPEPSTENSAPAKSTSNSGKKPTDKRGLLAYADAKAKAGKNDEAIETYNEIIKKWPSEAEITDAAHMRVGDLLRGQNKFQAASQHYVKIIEKFPSGSLVAAAYYRIGLTSMSLGNFEDAEIFFSEVKNNHKKSKWAKDADKQLAMVRKKLTPKR